MSADDKNIEPVTDLGLALGYSNQCIQQRPDIDSGAGANAGSKVYMTFVATDPLSELVWSPQKGLSLKCADGSFCDKKPSLLQGAGPGYMINRSSIDKSIDEKNFLSLAAFNVKGEAAGRENSTMFPTGDMGIMPLCGSSHELKIDGPKLDVAQNDPTSEEPSVKSRDVGDGNDTSRMEIVLASGIHTVKEIKACDTKMKGHEESPSFMKKHSENKTDNSPPERLESTNENYIQPPLGDNAYDTGIKIVESGSTHEVKDTSLQDDGILLKDEPLAVKPPLTDSRAQMYQMKGKAKALSDGNANGQTLIDEDDSHESVESRNSVGLYSTGKRRWGFEQQLIVGSKRVKRQIQGSPGSSSFAKKDSSFMNWISNMLKGFSKSYDDEPPSLANCNEGQDSPGLHPITCNKNQDPGYRSVGFQSIFQSLYSPKVKAKETITLNDDCQMEASREPDLDNKISNINATPIACHSVTGNLYKQFWLLNEKFNESTSRIEVTPVNQPKETSMNFAASQEINRSNSADDKMSPNLATDREKGGASSNSSLSKHVMNNAENIDSEPPFEGKITHNCGYRCHPRASLWISRFTSKTSGPLPNLDVCNKITGEALEASNYGMTTKPQLPNLLVSSNNQRIVEGKQHFPEELLHLQDCSTRKGESLCFHKVKGLHEEKSPCKINPIIPTLKLKNSEAMASVFARRLDALKHIMPSDITEIRACSTVTCFYCGIKGHHVRDCSEITETELKDLVRNINSYDAAEELPCVCIRCFQLNHWAVACPSKFRHQEKCDPSLVNEHRSGKMKPNAQNADNPRLLDGIDNRFHASSVPTSCDGDDHRMERVFNLNWNANEATTSGKMRLDRKFFEKDIGSSSRESKLKENQILLLSKSVNVKISDVPKGIFDAVKRLRLSRTNILKWINSCMQLYHLSGFFLRLRLGKWEEGLGGTGYYVASITGAQRESTPQKPKNLIAVNVGGVKCLVETQYVSNHDFLEDELMAWWSATLSGGAKIPSIEDLRTKVKEKKDLGF